MSLDFIRIISEHVDRESPSAQLEYRCPFNDRLTESANLVGGLIYDPDPSYVTPQEYPFGTGLFANSVDITFAGDFDTDGQYNAANLIVNYAPLNVLDPYGVTPISICQVKTQVSGDSLPLPAGQYKWVSSGDPLDEEKDIRPMLVSPYVELSVKVLFGAKPLIATTTDLVGKVNVVTIVLNADESFEPNTVLFLGCEGEQCFNCQGKPCWQRDLKFGIRNNDGLGWQALWNPANNAFDNIVTNDDAEAPPYEAVFLDNLFDIE